MAVSLLALGWCPESVRILPVRPSALCLFVHSSNAKDEQFDGIVRVVTIEEVPEGESGELQTILWTVELMLQCFLRGLQQLA